MTPVFNACCIFMITTCIYAVIATGLFKDKDPGIRVHLFWPFTLYGPVIPLVQHYTVCKLQGTRPLKLFSLGLAQNYSANFLRQPSPCFKLRAEMHGRHR